MEKKRIKKDDLLGRFHTLTVEGYREPFMFMGRRLVGNIISGYSEDFTRYAFDVRKVERVERFGVECELSIEEVAE